MRVRNDCLSPKQNSAGVLGKNIKVKCCKDALMLIRQDFMELISLITSVSIFTVSNQNSEILVAVTVKVKCFTGALAFYLNESLESLFSSIFTINLKMMFTA